jgi:hypothetical protein
MNDEARNVKDLDDGGVEKRKPPLVAKWGLL